MKLKEKGTKQFNYIHFNKSSLIIELVKERLVLWSN